MFSEHQNGVTEMAFMALPTNRSPHELTNLLNHIDLLKKFIPYFAQEAKDIIAEANKTPIVLPFLKEHEIKKATHLDDNSLAEFKTTVEMKQALSYGLTHREMQCLAQLAKGLSAKEIAREMYISYRTVEKHFENIKHKTGIESMKKLMALSSSLLQ